MVVVEYITEYYIPSHDSYNSYFAPLLNELNYFFNHSGS